MLDVGVCVWRTQSIYLFMYLFIGLWNEGVQHPVGSAADAPLPLPRW